MIKAFAIGNWWVEPQLNRISDVGKVETLGPKVMDALVLLAEREGELVGKEELVERVWKGAFISDEALTTLVYELRKALGDVARVKRYVGTVRGRGYRLLAEVREHPESAPRTARPIDSRPKWQLLWAAALSFALAGLTWFSLSTPSVDSQSPETQTLMVLPLLDASGDSSFSTGLTENLASQLARDDSLEVFDAFSQLVSPASRLETEAFVQGRVERLRDRISVSVRLVDAGGRLLWGGTFEHAAEDSGKLRRELAIEIAHQVRRQLLPDRAGTDYTDAQQAFLAGQSLLARDETRARNQFELAIERDPTFAMAHVGLAEALLAEIGDLPRDDRRSALHEARQAIEKALEIDDALADTYSRNDWNWSEAEQEHQMGYQLGDSEAESAAPEVNLR